MFSTPTVELKGRQSTAPAFTLIEVLVTLAVCALILVTCWTLFFIANQTYVDLIWQNRVNQEAQLALEDICDTVRLSGQNLDTTQKLGSTSQPQVLTPPAGQTSANVLSLYTLPSRLPCTYRVQKSQNTADLYLTRKFDTSPPDAAARFIVNVSFTYEYRLPSYSNKSLVDRKWKFARIADLGSWTGNPQQNPACLINTIYITMTAQVTPSGGEKTYQRTLHSAVHLRAPYDTTVPPALTGP